MFNEYFFTTFPVIFYSDINECATINSPCGTYHYLSCENKPGTYSCRCKMGYAFNFGEKECQGNVYFVNRKLTNNLSKTTSLDSVTYGIN